MNLMHTVRVNVGDRSSHREEVLRSGRMSLPKNGSALFSAIFATLSCLRPASRSGKSKSSVSEAAAISETANQSDNSSILRDVQKTEAIECVKALGLLPQAIEQFADGGKINISEPPLGALYRADENDVKRIREFEKEYGAMAYTVVHSFTKLGTLDSYLFVSKYTEEWPQDRLDIENNEPMAYVFNQDIPEFSEFGYIGIKLTDAAGLLRAW